MDGEKISCDTDKSEKPSRCPAHRSSVGPTFRLNKKKKEKKNRREMKNK